METKKEPITVEASVKAPVEKVWKCWTTPEDITQWNQASPDWHSPSAQNDVRPGGKFIIKMAAKDGSFSFDFEGIYDAVEKNKLISYTLADGRKVKIDFTSKGNETHITETFDAESTHTLEQQREGWQAIMNSFKRYTENN